MKEKFAEESMQRKCVAVPDPSSIGRLTLNECVKRTLHAVT